MHTPSWNLAKADAPKKFDSLMAGDFAQLTFVSTGAISEDLWVKVIGPTNKRDEYWAVLDDRSELITDIPIDYELIFKPCHVVDCITYNGDGVALVDAWGKPWGWYRQSDESDYAAVFSSSPNQLRMNASICSSSKSAISTSVKRSKT